MRRFPPPLAIGTAALLFSAAAAPWWWERDDTATAVDAAEARALDWEDLVPEGFVPMPDPFLTMPSEQLDKLLDGSPESERELARLDEAMREAPVDDSLDGEHVTLPGYVVPLDYDGQTRLTEFLLVPYFGACIHTPPPPANQIVLARSEEPVLIEDTYQAVELRGILHTESATTDLAETGYLMEVLSVEPYTR